MGKEPHGGSAGTGQEPGQPEAISNVRSARAAESVRPGHGADAAGEGGVGLYGQVPDFAHAEKGGPEIAEENVLTVYCLWSVVSGSDFTTLQIRRDDLRESHSRQRPEPRGTLPSDLQEMKPVSAISGLLSFRAPATIVSNERG